MYTDNDLIVAALADSISNGEWQRANCPLCEATTGKADKRRSLGVHQSGGWICHKCGAKGYLKESDEWAPVEAIEKLVEKVVIEPPQGFVELGSSLVRSSLSYKVPVEYMLSRGIPLKTIQDAHVGACLSGEYGGRIIIPIFATDGNTWLGFIARDWTNTQELRYRYPKGMQRGTIFYEQRVLEIETDEPALVVEGGFDILPYYGFGGACLGKPSKWQIEMFKLAKRPLAIALDGDAHREAWALANNLRLCGLRAGAVRIPGKQDPNTMAKKYGVGWLLQKAKECITEDTQ